MPDFCNSTNNIISENPQAEDYLRALLVLQSNPLFANLSTEMLESLLQTRSEDMKRKEILKKYDIKQIEKGKNAGIWYVIINGKKMQSKDRRKLEDKLIKLSKENSANVSYTFKEVYEIEQEKQLSRVTDPAKKVSRQNTIIRHNSTFKKYIAGSKIENMPISEITDVMIEDFLIDINDPPIKKKELKNLTGIMNQTFRRAKLLKLISTSPMEYVDLMDFHESCQDIYPIGMRAYSEAELHALYESARKLEEENPADSAPWAYELCLLIAPRRGEIPPLEWTDIDNSSGNIVISKQLLKNDETNETIIKHLPKNRKMRYYPITLMTTEFLGRLKKRNEKYYPDSPYLFPCLDEINGFIRLRAVYDLHRDLCTNLNIAVNKEVIKGPHSFRRSHESEILSSGGSIEMTGHVYGNTPRSIANHYQLSSESKAVAPYIDDLQNKLFSFPAKNEKSEKQKKTSEPA